MEKQRLIEIIERMIMDKNQMINSGKGSKQYIFAWNYSRIDLENVLKCVKNLESELKQGIGNILENYSEYDEQEIADKLRELLEK